MQVLSCDNHLLLVVKPAGQPTVPDASGDPSLLDAARVWVRTKYEKPGAVFLGVVHRLDRPVSGIVAFARTSKAARRLTSAFRDGRVEKRYWAVLPRAPDRERGELDQWLEKDRAANRVHVRASQTRGARRARTEWRVLDARPGACLVELRPLTGRPHQLRVAMASLGLPILGDLRYGAAAPLPDRSIALHAVRLAVPHPTREVVVAAVLPPPAGAVWDFPACRRARASGGVVEEKAGGELEGGF